MKSKETATERPEANLEEETRNSSKSLQSRPVTRLLLEEKEAG